MDDQGNEAQGEPLTIGWTYLLQGLHALAEEISEFCVPHITYDYEGDILTLRGFRKRTEGWRVEFINREDDIDTYIPAYLVQRGAPDVVVYQPLSSDDSGFENKESFHVGIQFLLKAAVETDEGRQREIAEKARIAEEKRLADEALRELADRQEKQQRIDEDYRLRKAEEAQKEKDKLNGAIADADGDFSHIRGVLLSSGLGTISSDLEVLMPEVPDWNSLLDDYRLHHQKIARIGSIHDSVRKLLQIDPHSPGDFLVVSSVFRTLLEPQCSVAIGRSLDARGYSPIIPSYVGALMDLGYPEIADEICRRYWVDIDSEKNPKFLLAAYHRVARTQRDTESMEMLEAWAAEKRVEFSGNQNYDTLPTTKRREKRKMLFDHYDRSK